MSLIQQMRLNWKLMQVVKDPAQTEKIFDVLKLVSHPTDAHGAKQVKTFLKAFYSRPGIKNMYEEQYVPVFPKLEDHKDFPEGSFGKAYYDHMIAEGLDPDFYPEFDANSALEYTSLRISQVHDYYHVLFGYSTSVQDELALQAVAVAQYESGFPVLIIAGGLLNLLKEDAQQIGQAFEKIVDGYQRGKSATYLLEERLEDMLTLPLEEVRDRLGIPMHKQVKSA